MILDFFKALADPSRLRLAAILTSGEFTVQELTRILDMGQSRISRHLKILVEAGILSLKRQGTWSYYRIGNATPFFNSIRELLEKEFDDLPERGRDLAAVAEILEARRQRSQDFFDRHARQWDDLVRTLLPVPEYYQQLVGMLPENASVVEIGLGTGGLLPALAAKSARVIGVDHSPAMLEEARRRLELAGLSGIELLLGEMGHLPLPDHSMDCALLNMVLHHAAEPVRVLHEIRRVLADKGLLLMADLARHEREVAREQLADQWLGFEEEELRGWLANAGFCPVVIEHVLPQKGQETVLIIRAYTN